MDDRSVVAIQIGRPPRSPVEVVGRCHLGLPIVTAVPPLLDDGTPFPTHYWLGCPLAVLRVSRLESSGGVADAEELLAEGGHLRSEYERAMERYAAERDRLIPTGHSGPRPSGGVGGSHGGVKCLHAHYADHAAGNENPIGSRVADRIEPLDCALPCVVEVDGGVTTNAEWSEP